MTSRLKWVKTMLTEMLQDRRCYYGHSDKRGLTGSSHIIRPLKDHDEKSSCRYNGKRERRRAHKHLQMGSALKEAVASLIIRARQGTSVDSYGYVDVLQGCSKQRDLELVKQVHDCIKKSGLEQNAYVANNLLKCYIACGELQIAQELFSKLSNKNVVSWTTMIGGYAQHDKAEDAMEFYKQLRDETWQPNAVTYLSALKACASPVALKWGKEIHAHITHDGLEADVRVGTALVTMYARCGSIQDARAVFAQMKARNVITWTAMVGGLAQHGLGYDAFSLFLQMEREGFTPDAVTYVSLLNPCSSAGALEWVKEAHAHAKKAGLDVGLRVGNAFVHMYAKSGSIGDARKVFDRMEERDVSSWNVIIGGLSQHGLGHEAFSLFLQMQEEGFTPDSYTYVSILNPCSSTGALEWVKEIHAHAMNADLDVGLRVGNALVHMYAKIGSIADARQVFDKMLDRDVFSWTVMIGGLAQHGHGREALQLFEMIHKKGVEPNGPAFVTVLSACSHAGLVDEGRYHFVSMTRDYGIEPELEHYTSMADILARAGHLEEAKLFILNMPIQPNVVTWGALLGACRIYNICDLAELAAKECLNLKPMLL